MSAPRRAKNSTNARKRANWTANVIRFESRIETGTAMRGKYTLPNRLAFCTNVLDGLVQALRKIGPHHRPRHVEQELRQSVRGQAGDPPEDHRERDRGQQRLDQVPQRSQDGLLVHRHEVPPHEEQTPGHGSATARRAAGRAGCAGARWSWTSLLRGRIANCSN